MNIYEKLTRIQNEVKVPKNQYSKYGGYYYRNIDDIQEALKPILIEFKCALRVSCEPVVINGAIYQKAVAELVDWEDESFSVRCYNAVKEEVGQKIKMTSEQVSGSAITYAKKGAISTLLCIDDSKDSDADTVEQKSIIEDLLNQIEVQIMRTGLSIDLTLKHLGYDKIELVPKDKLETIVRQLKQKPDKKEEK